MGNDPESLSRQYQSQALILAHLEKSMVSDEQKRKSWHEILASLTPLILGICVTGVGAYFSQIYNFRQLQLNQLTALDKFRSYLVSDNSVERAFAYSSFVALGYEDLALKLIKVKGDSAGREAAQEVKQNGSGTSKSDAAKILDALPYTIYMHIGAEAQREAAKQALVGLQQLGYTPAGIENVAGKANLPKATEVRYFNVEDKSTADAIATSLQKNGYQSARSKQVSIFKVKSGNIEVWFAAAPP